MTSEEYQVTMNPWELRTTLNAVNAPPKTDPEKISLGNNYSYKREVEYKGFINVYSYTIYKNNEYQAQFNNSQYPSCCGISILHNFSCNENTITDDFTQALISFFTHTKSQWKPNIQFVAIKQAEFEEEYNEEDDEWDERITGMSEEYDYQPLINKLQSVLKPTLLSSFINKNSNNQCDLYQAVNPFRE